MKKKILLYTVLILIAIQLIRIDKQNPTINPMSDLVSVTHADTAVANILYKACYDCHSYQSTYPWYTNIAPVSWWVKDHINDGRRHLNFSIWDTYTSRKRDHKLKECVEVVEEG